MLSELLVETANWYGHQTLKTILHTLTLSAVCCVNFVKLACMLYSMGALSGESPETKPLSIIGDAIASFLSIPDTETQNLVFEDKIALKTMKRRGLPWSRHQENEWTPRCKRWYSLVSKKRLGWSFSLYVHTFHHRISIDKCAISSASVVIGGCGAMIYSFKNIAARAGTAKHLLDIGFGEADQFAFGQLAIDISQESPGTWCAVGQAELVLISP